MTGKRGWAPGRRTAQITVLGLFIGVVVVSLAGPIGARASLTPQYGGTLSVSYSVQDLTTGSPLSCGGSFALYDDIQFTAYAQGGTPSYTYSWNWGDGTGGAGNPATYAYSAAGTVNPTVTVSDSGGNTASSGQGCDFTVTGGSSSSGCPDQSYYGSGTQLDLQTTVDCALGAGFSGNLAITFVSMAYQESTFCPGAIESGSGSCAHSGPGCASGNPNAEGILQEGTGGQCPPSGGAFPVNGYSPSTCSTWGGSSSNWGGIYFNPQCSFQWAISYYNSNGYAFWGSYLSGAYCKWAPVGFGGTGSKLCDSASGYPNGGENLANLPWGTVCPNAVCASASIKMTDLTTGQDVSSGQGISPGDTIEFQSFVHGVAGEYSCLWSFGDGTSATGNTVNHTYRTASDYRIVLNVMGSQSHERLTSAAPLSLDAQLSAPPGDSPTWLYLGAGVAVVAAVVAVAIGWDLRRRKQRAPPPPEPSPMPEPPALP